MRVAHGSNDAPEPSVAIVHDYLTQRGGAERVVLALARAFPRAPIHTSLYQPDTTFPEFGELDIRPLWLDRAALLRRRHRLALPLLPLAFATSTVEADAVVCSSSGWAHGIRTHGRKIVYCHAPAKWLYRRGDYLGSHPSPGARAGLAVLAPALRRFDRHAAAGAERYVANSTFIAGQIRETYGIAADVVHPPGGIGPEGRSREPERVEPGFVLTIARLLPYKHVTETVDAFRQLPGHTLVVVGDGPGRGRLQASLPRNVCLAGEVDDATLRWLYAHCAGVVAASREDFGLVPVEAARFGKPTAALRFGGFPDTVLPDVTGVLFERPEPASIAAGVEALLARSWDEAAIRAHARHFSEERFAARMREIVAGAAA